MIICETYYRFIPAIISDGVIYTNYGTLSTLIGDTQ
jgi:hypothetical protein